VEPGRREAAGFVSLPWVGERLRARYGFWPYPGTLNLRLEAPEERARWAALRASPGWWTLPPGEEGFCPAACLPVRVEGAVLGVVVVPAVPGYPQDLVEVLAPESLRQRLGLRDGDPCRLEVLPAPAYPCVLFDLEGTLVDFQWRLAEAEAELRRAAVELGCDPGELASENYAGIRHRALERAAPETVDRRLGPIYDRYDLDALSRWSLREGAAEVLRDLAAHGLALGLVTNIGRRAAEGALERFALGSFFGAAVTRNDVARMKPDPEGIGQALRRLGKPGPALMVGDSLSDLFAARGAGVAVAIVAGGESSETSIRAHEPDHFLAGLAGLRGVVFPGSL
jgi:HAD superfamily hydrolase (TIGR01549 family)